METKNSRATSLLDKVYTNLESVDVSKLTFREQKEFLEVLQQCRFLEGYGLISPFSLANAYGYQPTCSCGDHKCDMADGAVNDDVKETA